MPDSAAEQREEIAARTAGLASIANADPVLARRGRYLNTICQLDIGDDTILCENHRWPDYGGAGRTVCNPVGRVRDLG